MNLSTTLLNYQNILLNNLKVSYDRFLYEKLPEDERLVGIVGLRGTGKTTMLLKKLKNSKNFDKSIYFSLDNTIVVKESLFLTVSELYFEYGYRFFYIDEIHKYKNWNQELKNIYDSFPDAKVLFSGSSSIDIIKGSYDLSRRALIYKLPILSFREYLNIKNNIFIPKLKLIETLTNIFDIEKELLKYNLNIKKEFIQYLSYGEFAFFNNSSAETYIKKLNNSINKIIYEDISVFYNLKTENLNIFKEIIYFIVNSKPGLFSYESLAKQLKISSDTLKNYVFILEEVGLLKIISFSGNITQSTAKAKKLYLSTCNIHSLPSYSFSNESIGRIRESFFINNILNSENNLGYSKKGDFELILSGKKYIFEVGGKNKTKKQIKDVDNSFLVKDNITWSEGEGIIPLWFFGLLY